MNETNRHENPLQADGVSETGDKAESINLTAKNTDSAISSLTDLNKFSFGIEGLAAILKLISLIQIKVEIWATRQDLKNELKLGYSHADRSKQTILQLSKFVSSKPIFKGENIEEGATKIQRWFIGKYVEGLLSLAKGNSQLDASSRGFAWHFLATDANNFLKENGQKINNEWLFGKMSPLIMANNNPKAIKQELSRFTQGDPEVISPPPPTWEAD